MAKNPLRNSTEYFATLELGEFIREAENRIHDFYQDLMDIGLFAVVERSYRAYYGANLTAKGGGKIFDSASLQRSGKRGEVVHLKMNHYRSLLKHTLQLSTGTKPAYGARATNSDSKSQGHAILADGLLDYYLREKKLQRRLTQAVENGLLSTEGWIHSGWDATAGEEEIIDPETGEPVMEGDVAFGVYSLLDVARDINLTEEDEHSWLLLRRKANKFDLAAKYPDLRERILSLGQKSSTEYELLESFQIKIRGGSVDSDMVTVWTFYHAPTDAVPAGRLVEFVGDIGLIDGPLPYRRIPLHKISPENLIGSPYGYSPAFDLLGPQQGLDILSSTVLTNQASHGVQSIWTKRGDDVDVTALEGGMTHLQSDEMPQGLQLTKTPPEIFAFRKDIIGEMETLSGISATVRGNPEASLESGAALALVVSQSVQFASLLEASYYALFEDVGTDLIINLRDFSVSERVANIVGIAKRPMQKTFKPDDLEHFNRVVVEATSPLSKTIAGRVEIANNLLAQGFVKTPQQYILVLTTGQLDPVIEGEQHEMLNIRAENEDLQNGRPVRAILTDLHEAHIREHKTVIANPESRKNPRLLGPVLAHIQQHLDEWRRADPAILMITGQNPPPPPPGMLAPTAPPPGGPGPAGASGPGAPDGAPPVMQRPGPALRQEPDLPQQPDLPPGSPPAAAAALQKVS